MKTTAMLAMALLFAQAAPQQQPLRLEQLRGAALQLGVTEPIEVLLAEKAWTGADVLLPLALFSEADVRAGDLSAGDLRTAAIRPTVIRPTVILPAATRAADIRTAAIRALGRLEDPRLVPQLIELAKTPYANVAAIASAVAQSLNGFDPVQNPELVKRAAAFLRQASAIGPLGSLTYANEEEVHATEKTLRDILEKTAYDPRAAGTYIAAIASLESLGRHNARVTRFDDETLTWLSEIVAERRTNDSLAAARENGFAGLLSARAVDADSVLTALKDTDPEVRRLATTVLSGAGAGLADEERFDRLQAGLSDPSPQVRYEALRGYIRRAAPTRGCGPILGLLDEQDPHVMLAAIDGLGDLCKDDEDITTRLAAEARTPQMSNWHRETHAFMALAKRAPDRLPIMMEAFATHNSWWVRMYSVRAAVAAEDLLHLDKLAYDVNDNVRDAALGPLRRLKKADAEPAIVAALDRNDVQLLRTAAMLLKDKETPHNQRLVRPLMAALQRLTKEGKETSRDARLPLLDAIAEHGKSDDALELQPLLKDFDPQVAVRAAEVITRLTGKAAVADPKPRERVSPPSMVDLRQCVTVTLASGPSFRMVMQPEVAPITVDRFLKLVATDHYYDGLTIHRIVPNFVIQGGSPGANEYSGHKDYMRDEIGGAHNSRGTVGLSTRGRNTADAQFYINMVNNPRLDADYTVFAHVLPADMGVVDRIQEGDVMRLSMAKCIY
jgi:cyclophilin family peptidyl-prolyl cis-trans isomerase/HEAT repeat protein